MLQRVYGLLNQAALKAAPYLSLADRFREAMGGFPPWLAVGVISMLPIFELRGGIPAGKALGLPVWEATAVAVFFNMLPIPFVLWFLGPFSRWLSRHFQTMDRFFTWLFARTRRKHSKDFERWQEVALMIFVGIPLPMTGAWSGVVAAFVFDIPFWPALLFIFLGVIIAAVVVALATSLSFLVGWQGSLIFFALLTGVLVFVFMRGKKEFSEELDTEASQETSASDPTDI
jgi:uncharacterized membrane protein